VIYSNNDSINALDLADQSGDPSDLKLNRIKTAGLWAGNNIKATRQIANIKKYDTVKAHGIRFDRKHVNNVTGVAKSNSVNV